MALTNEQFQKISRIYEERRMNNDYQLMHRKEEIYEKIPAYHDLDRQIADLSMACSRALISDANDMEPSARLAALRSQILDLRLAKLIGLEIEALLKDHEQTLKNIALYKDILMNPKSMDKVII